MKHNIKIILRGFIFLFCILTLYSCLSVRDTSGYESSRIVSPQLLDSNNLQIIAHRGFWGVDGSAENSIRSLQAAAELGVYGSEFDVHLTADNIPMVYHDNIIRGTNINIQQVSYNSIKDVVLPNGEKFPTLDTYLEAGKTLSIKLILEIKTHATPARDREAAQIVVNRVKHFGMEDKVEYITFSLEAGKELIRLKPDSNIGYLNGDLSPFELKEYGFSILAYYIDTIHSHSEYINESKELGLKIFIWTVNDLPSMERLINLGVNFIITDIPMQAKEYFK